MKIVINKCFGGYGLSHKAVMRYAEIKGITLYPEQDKKFSSIMNPTYYRLPKEQRMREWSDEEWRDAPIEARAEYNKQYREETLYERDIPRNDPVLVQVVEELGDKANGMCAKLKVVEVPDGIEWEIDEYDGQEHIDEIHRSWG